MISFSTFFLEQNSSILNIIISSTGLMSIWILWIINKLFCKFSLFLYSILLIYFHYNSFYSVPQFHSFRAYSLKTKWIILTEQKLALNKISVKKSHSKCIIYYRLLQYIWPFEWISAIHAPMSANSKSLWIYFLCRRSPHWPHYTWKPVVEHALHHRHWWRFGSLISTFQHFYNIFDVSLFHFECLRLIYFHSHSL